MLAKSELGVVRHRLRCGQQDQLAARLQLQKRLANKGFANPLPLHRLGHRQIREVAAKMKIGH